VAAVETQPGTGLMPYAAPQDGEYRPAVMTADAAKALDEQVRACTRAVLREGTDYGIIPGTNGEKTLWRPGAQKLLQWFGFSVTCERVELERDDDGRKHGITYRATVTRRLPDGSHDTLATCEGTADYDESKFYQTEEQVRSRLRDQEHKWAKTDHRAPNADRWLSAREYRADWNALMKRAQKRAIVGAVVDATAAGGIFSDREEDDSHAAAPDDGQAVRLAVRLLDEAAAFTTETIAGEIWREAAAAAREGLITPGQATHIQNRIRVRLKSLQQAAQPVHVGDLARQAATQTASPAAPPPVAETAYPPVPAGEAQPAMATGGQAGIIESHFERLGYDLASPDDQRAILRRAAQLARRDDIAALGQLTQEQATRVMKALDGCTDIVQLELLGTGEAPHA